MNRTTLVFFALASMMLANNPLSSRLHAQSSCTLTTANSPGVRGIKLGMSADQVIALFPGASKRKETKDALEKAKSQSSSEPVYLTFDPTDGLKDQFAGVASVSTGFSKGRVIDLNVQYVGPEWKNVDEWITKLSETFGLPAASNWQTGSSETPNKILRCSGVEIEAAVQGGGGSIRIRSTENSSDAQDRTRAAEEKKKRDYKP